MFDVTQATIRLEKDKARQLRKSRWWQNIIQRTTCYYCQINLDKVTATMDHIVPISRGGRSTRGNVVPACKTCNTRKKTLTPVEWTEFLARQAAASRPDTL